uniref:Si:dkeyp-55f12.3 n=1 Tax=Sinocyclocheilus anshuiensis TaxID=1608454 RepID=A0A671QUW3_9TELE
MAACELKGELKYRDGQTNRQFTVQVDGNLKSMITGIKKLNADISEVLTALVEQERGSVENKRGSAENSTADVDGKLLK